ncbi:MAG: transketolase [Candidatus Babeliales bacterium]
MKNLIDFLNHKAYLMRVNAIRMTTQAGSGHMTSALSAADIVAALFFWVMNYDPTNHHNQNNDHFILSKGHAAPILYAVWKEVGYLTGDDLMTYREFESVLEGHPTPRFAWSEAATGSLGQGLSVGAGMALNAKMFNQNYYTYVLMGDSELAEGSIWEAAQVAAYYNLNNLIGIVDANRLGQTAESIDGHSTEKTAEKFRAFGWNALEVPGHDSAQLLAAFDSVKKSQKPSVIIAKTYKGYGVDLVEDENGHHGKALTLEQAEIALEQLAKRFSKAASYAQKDAWTPKIPHITIDQKEVSPIIMAAPAYTRGELVPARKAYGQALASLGNVASNVVALDAEVKNSTYAEIFEKAHPNRFVQCFIAEQNMMGMAVGFAARGKIPFASTFGAFMSRAFDQIRMAAIGRAPLRLCGSHAGVSIGEDGPSQMALEDIALMRTLPDSIVLYPCDAVSAWKMVELMANYHDGISYLRTTRRATPVRYGNDEEFRIGGCKILKHGSKDIACIVAAGITVVNALEAAATLEEQGVHVSVIDLYSIKPLDAQTLIAVAKKSGKRIITVEDHYLAGGIGEAVAFAVRNEAIDVQSLAVTKLPRSGQPDELMAYEEIDAFSIVRAVKDR